MLSKLQIINEIGHGSFGNVKKVRNKKNNKIFALKEIELNSRLELNKNLKEIRNLYSIQSHMWYLIMNLILMRKI